MQTLSRWLHTLVGWPIFLLVTALLVSVGGVVQLVCWPWDRERRAMLSAARWGWGLTLWVVQPFWRLRRVGTERAIGGPFIVVANHQSVLDIPAVLGLPLHFRVVARPGIFRIPILGQWMWASRQIPLGGTDPQALRVFFREVEDSLREGISVLIFPEGTRSVDGELGEFHRGAFRVALDLNAPVLPVAIDGTRNMLSKGKLHAARFPSPCGLVVRPPIWPGEHATARQLATRAKQEIEAGLAELRAESPLVRAAERYAPLGRFALGFARGKLSRDPVYAAVLPQLPTAGLLVDVGCGEGYLLAAAREARPELQLRGVDHDARRVAQAVAVLADGGAALEVADARGWAPPPADAFALLDVLHYQPIAEQDRLLATLAAALRPGGLLLVRDGGDDTGWRSRWLAWVERAAVALGRHRGDGVFFRPSQAVADVLRGLGLEVEVVPCHAGTPFANFLTIARKPK